MDLERADVDESCRWPDLTLTDVQRCELDERLARADGRRAMAELIVARDRAAVRQEYWHGRFDELAGPIATAAAQRFKTRRPDRAVG